MSKISRKMQEERNKLMELPLLRKVQCPSQRCGAEVTVKRLHQWGYPFNWGGECKVCGQMVVIGCEHPKGIIDKIYWKMRYGEILV